MEGQGENGQEVRRLGDFLLRQEIGRGGMGVVYEAVQESLDRVVALKVLPRALGLDSDAVARFQREAEAAGRLAHPGIVPIYGVWQEEGVHYFAMELVEGPSLHAVLLSLADREPAGMSRTLVEEAALIEVYPGMSRQLTVGSGTSACYPRSCAALIMEVAEAVAAAHDRQVIHRDIKPSNILLHQSGRAVVVDFGLVWDPMSSHLTRTGDTVGTPSYMAPEQAAGERDLDERVDVYGLGATLYELLTLQPPFGGGHAAEIMQAILEEDPIPVRKINPRVPRDLAAIVHKCLRKRPEQRYHSAAALCRDLRAFVEGRPVSARPPRGALPFTRWLRRRSSYGQAAGLAIVSTTVLAVLAGVIVRDSAERRGLEALETARSSLGRADPARIEEAYGRAAALLGEQVVIQERRRHLGQVFEDYYSAGRFAELRELLGAIPEDARGEAERAFEVRLLGQGVLELDGMPDGVRAKIRYKTSEGTWQVFPEDGRLPIGDLDVLVQAPGHAPALHRVRIERDQVATIRPALRTEREVPEGMVLVPTDDPWQAFAVSRTELTMARYVALLRGVDGDLRDDLQPAGWDGNYVHGDQEKPVTGLSFAQARLAAALLGGHLPSGHEFLLAGGGALAGHDLPWRGAFDPSLVAADPSRFRGPVLAESMPAGASPYGVLHLLGNAAEFLSAPAADSIALAGGHYGSDPGALTLSHRERLPGVRAAPPYSGVRIFRFLPPAGDGARPEGWDRRRAEAFAADRRAVWARWELGKGGDLRLRMRSEEPLPDTLEVPGFAVIGDRRQDAGDCVLDLLPTRGMHASGDGYVARLPHVMGGRPALGHELHLPTGTILDGAIPPPTEWAWRDGRLRVLWTASAGAPAPDEIWLRLRRDGLLTDRWPVEQSVRAVVAEFFDAFRRRSFQALAQCVTTDFEYRPAALYRRGEQWSRTFPTETFEGFELRDWTAVGPVVCAEVLADWVPTGRDGTRVRLENWPLRLFLLREAEGMRVRCVEVGARPDEGVITEDGYRHVGLGLKIELAAGERLWRSADDIVPLQVLLLPPEVADGTVALRVVGTEVSPAESVLVVEHRLSRGDLSTMPGELRTGRASELVGSHEAGTARPGRSTHWLFQDRDGSFRRERWTVVQSGGRCFLLRASVRGTSRDETLDRYRRWEQWFDAAHQRIHIR